MKALAKLAGEKLSAGWIGIALALVLSAAAPVSAQQAVRKDEILAQMPKELGGIAVLKLPDGMLMYLIPGPGGNPMVVGVTVVEKEGVLPPAELRSLVRKMMSHNSPIRKTVREGTFTTPKWPGAATFFGHYQTDKYFHQSWTVMTGNNAIAVLATYEKKKDAGRAEALVAETIFRGAVVSADKPAE